MPPADMTAPEYPETFPELLKWHRVRAGLSQVALCRKVYGDTSNYLWMLEHGRHVPLPQTIVRLAECLHLSLAQTVELMRTAGHRPSDYRHFLAPMALRDSTVQMVIATLSDRRLSETDRVPLRHQIEVMCATWLATVPGRVAERREA